MRRNKGITLISLVVTIIVLLILAGVSLRLVMGENGILGKTEHAVSAHEIATAKEQFQLWASSELVDYFAGDKTTSGNEQAYLASKISGQQDLNGYTVKYEDEKFTVYKKGTDTLLAKSTIGSNGVINWEEVNTEPPVEIAAADIKWTLKDNGKTLAFSKDGENGAYSSNSLTVEQKVNITKVVFEGNAKFYPNSMDHWFTNMTSLTEVSGSEKIYTTEETIIWNLFDGCSSLNKIDLRNLNFQNGDNIGSSLNGLKENCIIVVGSNAEKESITTYWWCTNRGKYIIITPDEIVSLKNVTRDDYGKSVNYSVTVQGETLNNWRVFLKDSNYVYVIYDGYLKANLVPHKEELGFEYDETMEKPYSVYSSDADSFVNGLKNTEYWSEFASGIFGAKATGTPTKEQFEQSSGANLNQYTDGSVDGNLYVIPENNEFEWWQFPSAWWFATVSDTRVYYIANDGHVDSQLVSDTAKGIRPLVAIPITTKCTITDTNVNLIK